MIDCKHFLSLDAAARVEAILAKVSRERAVDEIEIGAITFKVTRAMDTDARCDDDFAGKICILHSHYASCAEGLAALGLNKQGRVPDDVLDEIKSTIGGVDQYPWQSEFQRRQKEGIVGIKYSTKLAVTMHSGLTVHPEGTRGSCQFDSVETGAVWVPTAECVAEIEASDDKEATRKKLCEQARALFQSVEDGDTDYVELEVTDDEGSSLFTDSCHNITQPDGFLYEKGGYIYEFIESAVASIPDDAFVIKHQRVVIEDGVAVVRLVPVDAPLTPDVVCTAPLRSKFTLNTSYRHA